MTTERIRRTPTEFGPLTRIIRLGAWISLDHATSLDLVRTHIYENPRLKLNTKGMRKTVFSKYGLDEANQRFVKLCDSEPLPFSANKVEPHVRSNDNTLHLSLHPNDETAEALDKEAQRVMTTLGVQYAPDLRNLVIASFNAGEREEASNTINALKQYLLAQQDQPHIMLSVPLPFND